MGSEAALTPQREWRQTAMRALILFGSLAAAVGAAACGTQAASPFAQAGQSVLRCEPGQHAVVNQSVVDGGTVTSVACAPDAIAPVAAPVRPAYYQPAYQTQPVAYEPAPVARPAVVRSEAPVVAERPAKRSWQKRAIVIGGSSGAGAGIGALIGGKKGALIGAAIGGGAGTVYEMNKK
jgi:hypothetical protein